MTACSLYSTQVWIDTISSPGTKTYIYKKNVPLFLGLEKKETEKGSLFYQILFSPIC